MEIKEQIRNYYVVLLTIFCFIMGSFSFLFYCSFDNWIIAYFLMQIMMWSLMIFVYKKVKSKFREKEWSDSIIFIGLILPFLLGSFLSVILMGSA